MVQASVACTAGGATAQQGGAGLEAFQWLLGDWVAPGESRTAHESWERTDRDTMTGIGSSESRQTGETRVTETLRLVARDGRVFYVATVPHNPGPVAFEMVEHDQDRFVFENLQHDFPNRIVYENLDNERLRVTVSGTASEGFAVEFRKQGSR
jgi:hypothetical protein